MTLDPWVLAILLTKLAAYVSFVSLIGAFFVIWLFSTQRASAAADTATATSPFALAHRLTAYLLFNSTLGLVSVGLFFLLQVGSINQNGLAGMFDWLMSTIVMQTAIGDGTVWKATSFLAFGVAILLLRYGDSHTRSSAISSLIIILIVLGFGTAATGFAKLGHIASLGVIEQLLLAVHVLAIAMWVGAFYPLLLLCKTEPGVTLHSLMKRFGDWGWAITLCLAVAGVYLSTQLLANPTELITTAYGAMLLLKILLVVCLLSLAALNKFRLVPALQVAGTAPLARSIKGELGLAIVILVVTSLLSTVTGPAHLM